MKDQRDVALEGREEFKQMYELASRERQMYYDQLIAIRQSPPSPPEVIEGRGQAVGDKAGWYWCYPPEWSNGNTGVLQLEATDFFTDECRFIRVIQPVLPPRATFQAPEKPELVKVRYKDREEHYAKRDGENFRLASGRLLYGVNCEVIDERT